MSDLEPGTDRARSKGFVSVGPAGASGELRSAAPHTLRDGDPVGHTAAPGSEFTVRVTGERTLQLVPIPPAGEVPAGMPAGYLCFRRALKIEYFKVHARQRRRVVTLKAGGAANTFSEDHVISVPGTQGKDPTAHKRAADLQKGDKVFVGDRCMALQDVKSVWKDTELVEVRFSPDDPVTTVPSGFHILSKGAPPEQGEQTTGDVSADDPVTTVPFGFNILSKRVPPGQQTAGDVIEVVNTFIRVRRKESRGKRAKSEGSVPEPAPASS